MCARSIPFSQVKSSKYLVLCTLYFWSPRHGVKLWSDFLLPSALCYNFGMAPEEESASQTQQDQMKELQKEGALRDEMSRGMYLSDMDKFKKSLQELQMARTEEEREKKREQAYEHYEEIKKQELGHLEFIAEKHMSDEFTFPYDSRQGAVWFMSMRRDIDDSLSLEPEKGGFDGESRKWMETLYDAVVWGDGQYSIQEGLNMIQWYYGALDAMGSGLPNMKHRITATNLVEAYAKDVRGAGSTRASSEGLQVRRGEILEIKTETIQVTDRRTGESQDKEIKYAIRKKEQIENIRELGVNGHDDFFYWRNLVAATAQYDYKDPTKEGLVDHSIFRMEREGKFIVALFGARKDDGSLDMVNYSGTTVPKEILNFYTMKDTRKNRAEYFHLMQALIETGARQKLEGVVDDGPIQDLVNEVFTTKNQIAQREEVRKANLQDRMSALVIRQGITFDVGSANSGPLAWKWDYAKDRDGNVIRKVDFGGINQAGDWYTPEFPFMHNFVYDKKANKRTGLILPTPDAYRKRQVQEKSPFEKPQYSLEEARTVDPWAYNEVMKIVAEDNEEIIVGETDKGVPIRMRAGEWRKENRFQIDNDVRLALKDVLWFQEIPLADGKGKNQLFANFIPHRFKLSFLDQAVLKEGPAWTTVGDKLRQGQKLSEVDWGKNIKEYQWDYWLVNINMAERWARFLAEPGDPRRSEELFANIGTMKELIKRVNLGSRGWFSTVQTDPNNRNTRKSFGSAVTILGVTGQMPIIFATKANERGGGLKNDLLSEAIKTTEAQQAWENQIRDWVFMAKYMPPDLDEQEGNPKFFNQTLALIMAVTGNNLYKIALEGGSNEAHDKIKAEKEIKTMLVSRNRLVNRNIANAQK